MRKCTLFSRRAAPLRCRMIRRIDRRSEAPLCRPRLPVRRAAMAPPPTSDLFVAYAEADRAWVEGYLLDALKLAGVRYLTPTEFDLGVPTVMQFEAFITRCERTLLVLSPAFQADRLAQFA